MPSANVLLLAIVGSVCSTHSMLQIQFASLVWPVILSCSAAVLANHAVNALCKDSTTFIEGVSLFCVLQATDA